MRWLTVSVARSITTTPSPPEPQIQTSLPSKFITASYG